MAIRLTCSQCGKELAVKDELAGRKGKCPGCGVVLIVPDVLGEEPAVTAQPVVRRSGTSWLWPAVGALAIAAIVGVFIVVAVKGRRSASGRWPFDTGVPKGFRFVEHREWSGRDLWVLHGRQLEGLQELLLVVRAADLPGRGDEGKEINVAGWAAELSVGFPLDSSQWYERWTSMSVIWSGGRRHLVALGEFTLLGLPPTTPVIWFESTPTTGDERSPEISAWAGTALKGQPYWLLVGGATEGNKDDADSLALTIDALCTAFEREFGASSTPQE